MNITILETGIAPAGLAEKHGSYGDMFERMLAPLMPNTILAKVKVYDGEILPQAGSADGFLITGSPAGVYEPHDWIAPLEGLVGDAADIGTPVVGICFGHQLMAQAFGGRVEKSDKGWGVGVHDYEVIGKAPASLGTVACAVSHQDQVVDLPKGAELLGGSSFCPNGIISYGQRPALSFQMHPEFEHEFAAELLAVRADRIPAEVASPAVKSFEMRSNRDQIARWIAEFFTEHGS